MACHLEGRGRLTHSSDRMASVLAERHSVLTVATRSPLAHVYPPPTHTHTHTHTPTHTSADTPPPLLLGPRSLKLYGLKPPPTNKKQAAALQQASGAVLAAEFICQHTLSKRAFPADAQDAAAASAAGTPAPAGALPADAAPTEAPTDGTPAAAGLAAAGAGAGAAGPSAFKVPKVQKHYMFHDEAVATFFRRLAWSPDGEGLAL
jgi:hypothetical protein